MSKPPAQPIHGGPIPRTGGTFPLGADDRICPLPRNRNSSGSTLSPAPPRTAERDDKANGVSTIERRLSAIVWNCSQRGTRTASAEGSDLPKKSDRHAGDAHPRFVARASRPGQDAAARLCRRSASLGDYRARPWPRPDRRWARLGRDFRQRRAGVPAWQDRLARGRERPWLVRRQLPYRSAGAHG